MKNENEPMKASAPGGLAATTTSTLSGGEIDIIPDVSEGERATEPIQLAPHHVERTQTYTPEGEAMHTESLAVGITIEMPMFGGTSGAAGEAWDDRELIDAWEVAREEFALHNPGPGSWLDKQTAALALGQPLAGAKPSSIASKWYTSSSAESRKRRKKASEYVAPPAEEWEEEAEEEYEQESEETDNVPPSGNGAGASNYQATNTVESLLGISKRRRNDQPQQRGGQAQGDGTGMEWQVDDGRPAKRTRVAFASTSQPPENASNDAHSPSQGYRAISPAYQPPSPSSDPRAVSGADSATGTAHGPQIPAHLADARARQANGSVLGAGAQKQKQNSRSNKGKGGNKTSAGNPYSNGTGVNPYSFVQPSINALGSIRPPAPHMNLSSYRPSSPRPSSLASQQPAPPISTGYGPNASGIYPEMGGQPVTRAFSTGSSMTREEASVRAVNAQWWAGYWHAMTEVLPSEIEYRAQSQ